MNPSIPYIAYMPFILGILPFVVSIVITVMLFRYLLGKKQLEHQQILAAIEKGTSLSELRPVKQKSVDWIRSLTTGVAFLLIGSGLATIVLCVVSNTGRSFVGDDGVGLFIATVLAAIGVGGIIRGILQRKTDKEDKSALDANNGQ